MRFPPVKIVITALFLIIVVVLVTLIATSKPKVQPTSTAPQEDNTLTNYIAEAQRKNDLERDEREAAYKLEKLAKAKKDSAECQFWTKQHANKASPRTTEKVTQFCEL